MLIALGNFVISLSVPINFYTIKFPGVTITFFTVNNNRDSREIELIFLIFTPNSIVGKKSVGYTYLLTEDVRLEKFGNLPLERQGRCRNVFVTGRYSGGFVRVGRWTGNLVLTKSIRGLRKDTHGIRRVTIKILVLNRCFWRRGPYRVSSRIRFRKMKSLNLIIFPVNFGDRFLKRYSPGRISSKVHESNTFRDTSGSSSLLRILRVVSQKLEREAFDQMMSSIKVEKTLEFVINEILTKYVPKCAVASKFIVD